MKESRLIKMASSDVNDRVFQNDTEQQKNWLYETR